MRHPHHPRHRPPRRPLRAALAVLALLVVLALAALAGCLWWTLPARVALCGFGVGLSWGTATATLMPSTKFEWVETDATYPE